MNIENEILTILKARGSAITGELTVPLQAAGYLDRRQFGPYDAFAEVHRILESMRELGLITMRKDPEGERWFPKAGQ